ncbi:hypothetical protein CO609_06760 [Lysobacteraceae bacterium NML91-0268]|nr:hypothetical protein CO609_06760 [Xanthomonadaceae bacterium NML91-0268]
MKLKLCPAPMRSKLFQAIACSLLVSAAPAALADSGMSSNLAMSTADCTDAPNAVQRDACRARQMAHFRFAFGGEHSPASTASAANKPLVSANYTEVAKLGDAESWKSDEFMQDWGLEAMNAHHAYARGLTGSGVRIGLFDSGVALGHGEFSGKNHQGLIIGNLQADGTRCTLADSSLGDLSNPDNNACFATDGGTPSIESLYWDPAYTNFLLQINPVGAAWAADYENKTSFRYDIHGTHVAGTMAANRDGNGMHGVAFGADFSSARLFGDSFWHLSPLCIFLGGPGCQYGQFADNSAFDDMYQQMNAAGVRAINHSWGLQFEPYFPDEQDTLYNDPELEAYWQTLREGSLTGESMHGKGMGLIQVWAAGNHSYLIPSLDVAPIAGVHATLPRHMPELEKYWLSVVNVHPTGDLSSPYILSDSSMKCGLSMEWCLAAPGTKINSALVEGLYLQDGNSAFQTDADGNKRFLPAGLDALRNATQFGYQDLTGTSMAAPHVTGALALLFERYPYLTNAQVRDVLLTTATDLGAPGVDDVYGWGMVNLKKAIEGYGQFRVDTDVNMVAKAGGTHGWNDARVWDVWTNDISGAAFSFSSASVAGCVLQATTALPA